ncbi:MAG: hypothetical protein LC115_13060 [Bacteroidia bacterium]|nr:hypothetical protein [Bacteroidia bacterium]
MSYLYLFLAIFVVWQRGQVTLNLTSGIDLLFIAENFIILSEPQPNYIFVVY